MLVSRAAPRAGSRIMCSSSMTHTASSASRPSLSSLHPRAQRVAVLESLFGSDARFGLGGRLRDAAAPADAGQQTRRGPNPKQLRACWIHQQLARLCSGSRLACRCIQQTQCGAAAPVDGDIGLLHRTDSHVFASAHSAELMS